MGTLELAADDELYRQCIAAQFRVCLDELDRLSGTCRSLARSSAGKTRKSSPYFELAAQLDADLVRLRELLRDRIYRTNEAGPSSRAEPGESNNGDSPRRKRQRRQAQ
jgi:hypothetical protein